MQRTNSNCQNFEKKKVIFLFSVEKKKSDKGKLNVKEVPK
jgi:hypothetical protein